jgi:hypothetical protein
MSYPRNWAVQALMPNQSIAGCSSLNLCVPKTPNLTIMVMKSAQDGTNLTLTGGPVLEPELLISTPMSNVTSVARERPASSDRKHLSAPSL